MFDIEGFKNSFTVNLFVPSVTCTHLANVFQTWKALNVAIVHISVGRKSGITLGGKVIRFICFVIVSVKQGCSLPNITKILKSIFSAMQYDFCSCCSPLLSHSKYWVWYTWLLKRPPVNRKQKFEEYPQWSRFSAGRWQHASSYDLH